MNVLGSVYSTQALLPAMVTKREGRIVFIASQAAQVKASSNQFRSVIGVSTQVNINNKQTNSKDTTVLEG